MKTEERYIIATAIAKLLQTKNPCSECSKRFNEVKGLDLCPLCLEFMGLEFKVGWNSTVNCPCNQLGKDEAIERATLNVETYFDSIKEN